MCGFVSYSALAIYLGGLEASVCIHLLGAQHVSTLERALEETRIYANAHRGFGVRASGQYETVDDPMDLTVQMPMVRQAASAQPGSRVSFGVNCFNCGRMGHMRDTCPVPRRAQSPLPAGGYGLHTTRHGWTSTDSFQPGNVGRQCFVCGALGHLAKECHSRAWGALMPAFNNGSHDHRAVR